jgi:hypothetical protein
MFSLLTAIWAVLTAAVLVLAIYRKVVATDEDDLIHVADAEAELIGKQQVVAAKLDVIDRWGKALTVFVLIYGLALAGWYLYQVWKQTPGVGL